MASAEVRLFTAGLPSADDWPKWYYQDLTGDLQGPFDAQTMIRWYQEHQLPLDLKCAGIHPQDSSTAPTNYSHFQRLQTLMDNAEAGLQYMPLRVTKGITEEGPATPTKGGTRAPAGPLVNHLLPQQPGSISAVLAHQLAAVGGPAAAAAGGQFSQDNRPDVTRALDQRTAAGMMQLTQQQLHMQGQGLLQQLHAQQQQQQQRGPPQQQQRGASAPRQMQQQQQPGRAPSAGRHSGAVASFHEQHVQQLQQPGMSAAAVAPAPAGPAAMSAADGAAADGSAADVQPGSEAWNAALTKLLSREGFSGKDADIKWRVILASGDRVGPFSCNQLTDWMLGGAAPKGVNKQQATQTAANPGALQLCGILSADYNAQRLPGMKFFKPLSQLVPAVAAGLAYEAVNKHDLQRGLPKPKWNEAPGPGGSMPAAAAAAGPLPSQQPGGKAQQQQGGKAGKAARAASAGSNGKGSAAARGQQQQQQAGRPRSGSAAGMAAAAAAAGLDGPVPANDKGGFRHPMALRQQQRQQQQEDAMSAAAAAANEALGGGLRAAQQGRGPSPGGVGVQGSKGFDKAGGQGSGFGSRPNSFSGGSASRGILMAANSMGGAAAAAAAQQQQLQPGAASAAHVAAIAAAAGQLGPAGLAQLRQQQAAQQVQMQMQGLSVGTPTAAAFLQGAQDMPQAMWLAGKPQQGQLPGQAVAGMFAAQQSVLGYQMQAGYAALASQAAGGELAEDALANGQLPRTSSSSGNTAQQELDGKASRVSSASSQGPYAGYQQQQQAAANGAMQASEQPQPLTPAMMQAAALLFLHMEQQQQQQAQQQQQPGGSQVRWWVQRSKRAYSGPFSGMQMYQSYLQPVPHMRFTDGTLIAAMSGGTGGRDVPPSRAFVPLSALLEAAAHGYCLLPLPAKDAAQQGPNSPPPQVRHFTSGTVVPLQQVLQAPLQQYYQQQQRQGPRQSTDGGDPAGKQQRAGMHGASLSPQHAGPQSAMAGGSSRMAGPSGMPPSPSKSRHQQQQQQMMMIQMMQQQPGMQAAAAAPGSIQLVQGPNGQILAVQSSGAAMQAIPAGAAMVPAAAAAAAGMGGMVAAQGMQGMPMLAAQGLPSADPLAVASALFTAGNTPPLMAPVWYLLSPSAEPHAAPKTQGPLEPTDMLAMFKEGRLGPASLVCATHRAPQGQQQTPPPPNAFQPLQALLATTSSDMLCHQLSAAAAMGGHMGQVLPAAALMQGGQLGHMGQVPMLIQVPVSGGQGGAAMLAVPAGMQLQMQQLHQMQMQAVPQAGGVAVSPAFVQQQGGLVLQQQQPPPMTPAAAAAAAAQQQQQQGPPDGRSNSASSAAAAPVPQQQQQQQQQQQAQRSGAVPTRVDTWGSLDAHEKLSAVGASQQQQQQLHQLGQHMSAGAQAVEAALATSRRASTDSHFSHGGPHSSSSGVMGMGALWMQQQQHQHSGPRSSSGSGSFAQFAPQQQQQQQQQMMHHQMLVRRTSSGSSRSNPTSGPASTGGDAAAAAVAAALAHAGAASAGMTVPMTSTPAGAFSLQMQYGAAAHPAQQQQQLHSAMLAGMAQAAAMAGIPEHQQQPLPPATVVSSPQADAAAAGDVAAAAAVSAEGSPASQGSAGSA
jgi:hypothetical protein